MKSIDEVLGEITNKKLLVVFPHPDDESVMAGGIILRAIKAGFQVTVLTLTEGNNGKIFGNGKGRSLAEIRRAEMAEAMSRLGVVDWIMWKFGDGKLRRTNKWRERLGSFLMETNPGLVVSYDFSGISGHPDHIAAAVEIFRTVKKMKNTRLFWASFKGSMKEKAVERRIEKYLQKPKFILEMSMEESFSKWWAVFAHKSQNLRGFLGSPWWYLMFSARTEWYSEADFGKKYKYKYVGFKI